MTDYTARYGLEFNPFIKNAKDILLETTESSEARTRLDYLKDTRGFGVLTGEPGRGKTTAARTWAGSLNPSLFKVSYSSLSSLRKCLQITYASLLQNLQILSGLL